MYSSYPCTLILSLFWLWVCYAVSWCCLLMSILDSDCISRLYSSYIQFFRYLISSFFFFFFYVSLIYNKVFERKTLYFIFAVLKQAIILLTSSFSLNTASDGPWNVSGLCPPHKKAIAFFRTLPFCLEERNLHIMNLLARVQRAFWAQSMMIAGFVSSCTKKWRSCLKVFKRNSFLYTSCELPLFTLILLFPLWFFSTNSCFYSWSNLDLFCSFVPRCKIFHPSYFFRPMTLPTKSFHQI